MRISAVTCAIMLGISGLAGAQQAQQNEPPQRQQHQPNDVSPVRGIQRGTATQERAVSVELRSIDGSNNNLNTPEMGSVHVDLARLSFADYADRISSPAGEDRPSARVISNAVFAQTEQRPNSQDVSDFLWQWGQFLDHDIDLTDGTDPEEPLQIAVPAGDAHFDPSNTGTVTIDLNRSLYNSETGSSEDNPRQQINEITAWVDASNVYGSDLERANALRTLDGSGKLKSSTGNLLPFNTEGFANAGGDSDTLFLAGDPRANEQVGLTVMHTLFMREHNRLAERIAIDNPSLSGDEIYQRARRRVIAYMQVITYREFLPLLLGENALVPYQGYQDDVNANIANEFSSAAYRFGHSTLSAQILRLNAQGEEIEAGHLALRDAFFRPDRLVSEGGIEPVLRGLASQVCQQIDSQVIDDVRNFLFGAPGAGGFDLVSLNIERGRDHGLASYNDVRRALELEPANSFADVSSDPQVQAGLAEAYDSVENIDLWVGGLAEDAYQGAMLGEVFYHIIKQQFEALRDGDRFWYQLHFSQQDIDRIERTRLSDIIRRNTQIDDELQNNVFIVGANDGNRGGGQQPRPPRSPRP